MCSLLLCLRVFKTQKIIKSLAKNQKMPIFAVPIESKTAVVRELFKFGSIAQSV